MKKFIRNVSNLSLAIIGISAMTVDVVADFKKAKSNWIKLLIILVDGLSLGYMVISLIDPIIDSVKEMAEGFAEARQSMTCAITRFINKLSKHTTDETNIDTDSADWRPRIYNSVEEFRAANPDADDSSVGIKLPDDWVE